MPMVLKLGVCVVQLSQFIIAVEYGLYQVRGL